MNKSIALAVAVFVCIALGWWCGDQSTAAAGGGAPELLNGPVAKIAGGEPKYTYVGAKKCKKCHLDQHRSWSKTKMAKAFETLKPGQAVEAKKKFNLDPEKDYTKDEKCLTCHTTGFHEEGGYATPDPKDKKAARKAKALQGVGCESCHGPGSGYIEVLNEIYKSQRKYKQEELIAVGMYQVDESVCKRCHNEESPTVDANTPFDYEKRKEQGTHEHKPLKLREVVGTD